jgi:hypothetical protein
LLSGIRNPALPVAVIGTITNASRVSWKDIQFHVDFLDGTGKRVDVGEREDYSFRLLSGETTSFKVSSRRELERDGEFIRIMA